MSSSVSAAAAGVSAAQITAASKSNLALAFVALPRQRRDDISIFYSFCRVVDDLADEADGTVEERQAALQRWKRSLVEAAEGEPPLAVAVRDLIARYQLAPEHFVEIILGCEMDLRGTTYETWDDLRLYCYRVASVVGLVSIEIFGAKSPEAKIYAVELGLALQITNILRDVAQDYREMGRVYLPREDLARFGCDRETIAAGVATEGFRELMAFEADRAQAYYDRAIASLPKSDRKALVAAEIMRRVYHGLLSKMRRDRFRVFERRYRLNSLEKFVCIVRGMLGW